MDNQELFNNTSEAEQAVLGALICSPTARDDIASTMEIDDFVEPRNRLIFQAISNLVTQGVEVDIPSIVSQLDVSMKVLDKVGGLEYLYELGNSFLGDRNAFYHVRFLKDCALSRRLITTMQGCIDGFKKEKIKDISEYIAECENKVLAITQSRRVAEFITANEVFNTITNKLKISKPDEKLGKYCIGIPHRPTKRIH